MRKISVCQSAQVHKSQSNGMTIDDDCVHHNRMHFSNVRQTRINSFVSSSSKWCQSSATSHDCVVCRKQCGMNIWLTTEVEQRTVPVRPPLARRIGSPSSDSERQSEREIYLKNIKIELCTLFVWLWTSGQTDSRRTYFDYSRSLIVEWRNVRFCVSFSVSSFSHVLNPIGLSGEWVRIRMDNIIESGKTVVCSHVHTISIRRRSP